MRDLLIFCSICVFLPFHVSFTVHIEPVSTNTLTRLLLLVSDGGRPFFNVHVDGSSPIALFVSPPPHYRSSAAPSEALMIRLRATDVAV